MRSNKSWYACCVGTLLVALYLQLFLVVGLVYANVWPISNSPAPTDKDIITSDYGPRDAAEYKSSSNFHYGLDFAVDKAPVHAIQGGEIIRIVKGDTKAGNFVEIGVMSHHNNEVLQRIRYLHLADNENGYEFRTETIDGKSKTIIAIGFLPAGR